MNKNTFNLCCYFKYFTIVENSLVSQAFCIYMENTDEIYIYILSNGSTNSIHLNSQVDQPEMVYSFKLSSRSIGDSLYDQTVYLFWLQITPRIINLLLTCEHLLRNQSRKTNHDRNLVMPFETLLLIVAWFESMAALRTVFSIALCRKISATVECDR